MRTSGVCTDEAMRPSPGNTSTDERVTSSRQSGHGTPSARRRSNGIFKPSVVTERSAGLWHGRGSVTIIVVMPDTTLPLSEIKKRLSEIVDGVESTHDRVVLTRNGRPAAVIMSPGDLEALEETLEILSNPVAVRAIRKAETEIDNGRALTADELRTKYLNR
jgi:antitoxin YefM